MQVFRHELNAFPLLAIVDQAIDELGEATLERLLVTYGVTRRQVSDPSAWVSVEFAEALLADITRELQGGEAFIERAIRRGMSPRYMGFLYPFIIGLGSPLFVYRQIPRVAAHVNNVSKFEVRRTGNSQVRISWEPVGEAKVGRFLCSSTQIQLANIPTLFLQPRAQVTHHECLFEGGRACVYDVRWEQPPTERRSLYGALAGFGLASGWIALTQAASPATSGLLLLSLSVAGWGLGKSWSLWRELARRAGELDTHNAAFGGLLRANEERYAELLEAKNQTEQVVEERTRELRVTAQQLAHTLEQVRKLDQAKTDFFSNVSHELRTPLTLVLGPLAELAEGREPAGGLKRAVDVMRRNGLRLLELINQLLDLHRLDAGAVEIVRVPTDLEALARRIVDRFAAVCAQRQLTITLETEAMDAIPVDPVWIESAVSNLVANAVRFAHQQVALRLQASAEAAVCEVEDDGPGISPEDIPRLFERFSRGRHQPGREAGAGLGLAIAQETARLHGGSIDVQSDPGKGTVFSLVLPRTSALARPVMDRPPAQTPLHDPAQASAHVLVDAEALTTVALSPDPSLTTVLVIDDDPEVRAFVEQALSSSYRVRTASSGEEGLACILESRPDIVVSDVLMPGMDGYQLCRELRRREETRALPVILLTARSGIDPIVEGFDAGADDYVAKPFHPRELLARMGVLVTMQRMVSELAHRERLIALGATAAALAHQVRSPLTAIVGGLPVVQRRVEALLDQPGRDLLQTIVDAGDRIEELISDLIQMSRMDRRKNARFRPADGVTRCVRLLEARRRSGVHIQSEIEDTAELIGRPGDVDHVFLNLIDNAVRAAEPSGHVRVRTFDEGARFVFQVDDSGPGIAPERRDAVFAPFFTTRPSNEGTGLGLAIARQVVLQHGGSINIDDSDLGGARFTVSLPVHAPP